MRLPARSASRPATLAALLLAVLASGWMLPAQAQWKWRDADGRITISDRPPPREVPEKDILSRPAAPTRSAGLPSPASAAPPAAAASAAPSALEREVLARRRAAEEEKAIKARDDEARNAARRAENCRQARNQLTALESGQRIARTNDKGEREVMDDQARAQEAARTREVIASECR